MREEIDPALAGPAAQSWWNTHSAEYRAEHGPFLDQGLVWGPEGWTEAELGLLGPIKGLRLLDLGCGQGQTSRWLADQGAEVVGLDISERMLGFGSGNRVCGDAQSLPFRDQAFDLAISAYGALPFIADLDSTFAELHRVVRQGVVFSTTHPIRWAFPDDAQALTINHSYFDRRPYVERDSAGRVAYSEHHRTLGDWLAVIGRNGFSVRQLIEPEWKPANRQTWGGWSPERGRLIPGTMLLVIQRMD